MISPFPKKIFFVVFVLGVIYFLIVISQNAYLTRKRTYILNLEHKSRMHVQRSKQALENYRAWSLGQRTYQKRTENDFPEGHQAGTNYGALPKKVFGAADITRDDSGLPVVRQWAMRQYARPAVPRSSVSKEMYGAFQEINTNRTNDKRWTHHTDVVCSAQTNIAFLKMHKCSSSTVQNILFRYGEEHDLDFVLPPVRNILGRTYFHKSAMIQFPVEKYNMLCHHTRFTAQGFASVMPDDAVFVTIIRDPVRMYESSFSYNDIAYRFDLSAEDGLELFMRKPGYYYSHNVYTNSHVRNPMLYDLGLQDSDQFNWEGIRRKILELTAQFDLVMITEYFDESLVLLRHLMCWQTDDMVYFVLNARSKTSVKTLTEDLSERIRDWNAGDVKLYDVFNQTFWKRVNDFGLERMREEVELLRKRIEFYEDLCIGKVIDDDARVWHPYGVKIDSFKLKPESRSDPNCARMIRSEIPYTQSLRFLQLRRYNMQEAEDVML